MTPTLAYRSADLEVRHVPAGDGRRHVVTFDPWHADLTLDRPAFGEAFLAKEGIAATHVLTRGNDWYQYPELFEALAAARATTAGAERVVTYGSSMGAYAAIRFIDAVGAHGALALSPQYSVDPRKAPFEDRWGQAQRAIRFVDAIDGPVRSGCVPTIVYDPRSIDRLHVARFRDDIPIAEIRIPHAGHPATTYALEAGLLRQMLFDLLDDTLDVRATEAALRARRGTLPLYFSLLADAQPTWRPRTSVALARRAAEMAPKSAVAHHYLAMRLAAAGAYAEAGTAHRASIALARDPVFLSAYSATLRAAGDLPAALAAAREAEAVFPTSVDLKYRTAEILAAQGDHEGVLRSFRELAAMDPRNRTYRKRLRRAVWAARWRRLARR